MHPVAVAKILFELGMDNECIIGALLHDVVEDTPYDIDYISREFGPEVALLVDSVTKLGQIPCLPGRKYRRRTFAKCLWP